MAARPHTSSWTTELEDLAKARWQAGDSGASIARQLGPPFTKNAVISLMHRHKAVDRPTPDRPKAVKVAKPPRPKKEKPAPKPVRVLKAAEKPEDKPIAVVLQFPVAAARKVEDVAQVSFDDLRAHHCRWPIGEPGDPAFGYCGEGRIEGKSYCPGHMRVAYEGLSKPKPNARFVVDHPGRRRGGFAYQTKNAAL